MWKGIKFTIVSFILCSLVYPLCLTGVSQLTMKAKANGSLIDKNGNYTTHINEAVGSKLIGQEFKEDCFFKGRISAINYNTYAKTEKNPGVSTGSFNYGASNEDLKARLESLPQDLPSDLQTASGSGLDPHISVESAYYQIPSIARASHISEARLKEIVASHTKDKTLGIFGNQIVNVLECNLDIAREMKS